MVRKKKTEELVNVPSNGWPKISQGTHLTVRTYEDGRTELIWDDKQLAKEVREAIETYELSQKKPNVVAKAVSRKKKVAILNSVEESIQAIEKAKKSSKKTTKGKTK